jgi:autotransporter-associated beta strand protein
VFACLSAGPYRSWRDLEWLKAMAGNYLREDDAILSRDFVLTECMGGFYKRNHSSRSRAAWNQPSAHNKYQKENAMRLIRFFSLVGLIYLTFEGGRAPAVQLTWDPLNNGGNPPAGGNWDTGGGNTFWYNGSSDVAWSQTSITAGLNGAIFGGTDGTWPISIDAGQVAVTNLLINNSGYVFSGSPIYFPATTTLSAAVADGKSVTFNCNLSGTANNEQLMTLGNGASMTILGNISTGGGGVQIRLAGPASSAYYLGGANTVAQMYVLGPVYLTNGSITTSASLLIGYPNPGIINGTAYNTGTLTVSGSSTVVTANGNICFVGRTFTTGGTFAGNGTLTLNSGTVNIGNAANRNLAICYDGGSSAETGTVNVNGGTLNVGSSSVAAAINFFETGSAAGETAVMNLTGGVVNSWNGILFGAASGSFPGGSATFTQSGGTLYIGGNGIVRGAAYTSGSSSITLSGGTVGALANWSSPLPMTLGTANGNITFQCADSFSAFHNISLSGALTGPGGLFVSGGGTLTLSGANNYAGSTVVSNGTLAIVTGPSPITNGPVALDGSAGSPAVIVQSSPGQFWTNSGSFTFQNGATTIDFEFGALAPSTTQAPIQVAGNVVFTVTPNVIVGGTAVAAGTYPLIKYTGTTSGTIPASATLPGYISAGYITNITATKTIALVVTSSTYNPALSWRVGSGVWDINTTSNWTQFGSAAKYTDGNAVIFDDTASGPSPITVTLNTVVNPLAVTANNATYNYNITGTGSIVGSGNLQLLGSGTMTLNGTNSYSGGTTISAGQLNINNGGDGGATAIGTGPLTINAGAKIDNTSGSNVTLQASIPENWNGNFTYLGSANSFNTGAGSVSLGNSVSLAVNANSLIVGSSISDGGFNYALTKTGNGALTLPVANFFSGGLTLFSGQLNLGDPSAAGSGVFTIAGGAIDNISGAEFLLAPASFVWSGSFSFLGTTNLSLFGTIFVPAGSGGIGVNVVSNTLSTYGDITSGNTPVIKQGAGTWNITGAASGANNLGLVVGAGQVNLAKTSGQAIGVGTIGLTVQVNALVRDDNDFQIHSDTVSTPVPITLSGVWDLNGHNENVDKLFINGGGTLRNGAPGSTSTLRLISGYSAFLNGANCQFDVTQPDGNLNLNGVVSGSGSLVKTGAGVLNLSSNNTYTGNTTVSGGALILNYPSLATSSVVTVASNATLQLNFTETNTVAALVINGVSRPGGVYNAGTDPAYLTGTGSLQVLPASLSISVSGNILSLSWSNFPGWTLQTNVIDVTVGNDWYDVPFSSTNSQLAVPLTNPAISKEFFRLRP